jgi:hypothetical protein
VTTIDASPRQIVLLSLVCFVGSAISYGIGHHEGELHGVAMAHAENGVRVSENDRMMQRIGVCEWAKIMREAPLCKTERP